MSNDKKSNDSPQRVQQKDEIALLKEHLEEARQGTKQAMDRQRAELEELTGEQGWHRKALRELQDRHQAQLKVMEEEKKRFKDEMQKTLDHEREKVKAQQKIELDHREL